ncbi:UNVERIFIED_ORG: hypothetical protein GGE63_002391 [Rhizobium esperanzae]
MPVSRCQRNTAISPAMLVAVRLGLLLGRDDRSAMPAVPSARKRAVQRATTFDVTPIYPHSIGFGASALKNGACHLLSTPRCQTGILVNVHSVLRESLKLGNLSFLDQDRMDNLLKAHIESFSGLD